MRKEGEMICNDTQKVMAEYLDRVKKPAGSKPTIASSDSSSEEELVPSPVLIDHTDRMAGNRDRLKKKVVVRDPEEISDSSSQDREDNPHNNRNILRDSSGGDEAVRTAIKGLKHTNDLHKMSTTTARSDSTGDKRNRDR